MMKYKKTTTAFAMAMVMVAGFPVLAGNIVGTGLILNLEAGDNPLHEDGQWQDLSGGDVYSGSGDGPARLESSCCGYPATYPATTPPERVEEDGVVFYRFSRTDPSTWGSSQDPPASSNPEAVLGETWSMGLWLRATGDQGGGEHQVGALRSIGHTTRFGIGMGTEGSGPYSGPRNNISIAEFRGHGSAENGNTGDTGVNLPTDGNFHHLVFTYSEQDGAGSGELKMYLDNTLYDLTSSHVTGTSLDFEPVEHPWISIGANFDPEHGRNFQGEVSTFRLYNTTLTAAEVSQNFNAGPSRSSSLVDSSLVAAPSAVSLSFSTLAGANYRVETVDDLLGGTWQARGYRLTGNGSVMWVTDLDTSSGMQNYRMVKTP